MVPVEKRIPAEVEAKDADGQKVHALFHGSKGKGGGLETPKENGSSIDPTPEALGWEDRVLPTAPSGG